MKDIKGKETQLGDDAVDGAVCQRTFLLKPLDKGPHLLPGNIFRTFAEDALKIVEISTDISTVPLQGMAGKAAQGDHLPVRFKISVHNGTSFVWDVKISDLYKNPLPWEADG